MYDWLAVFTNILAWSQARRGITSISQARKHAKHFKWGRARCRVVDRTMCPCRRPHSVPRQRSGIRFQPPVDDWLSITSIDKPERFGPLKSRLTADAAMFRELLDTVLKILRVELIADFKTVYFVKGAQNVFLYRVLNFSNHRRGNQGFVTFISKFEILLRRLRASWMDTMPKPELTREFHDNLAVYNRVYTMIG